MFRTSYVHYQEDYTVHAALYGMFPMLKLQLRLYMSKISNYKMLTEHFMLIEHFMLP
jgi:hypothetical protein